MAGLIRVSARRAGFRRGGRAWGLAPTEVDAATMTPSQLAALEAEPMLVVERLAEADGNPKQPKPGKEA
ncbi:HI1506-related protein [Pararhodospirillum photometricum]|uniref:Uncharacterized protein n=1 Tax=Pararhodospirillum photometricum DSM 122 TaxID=1150469 RepID=H6SND9_PARPM|nr:HI1506-related protein [Pararhodospirillum photometricum]CCG09270.1 unnamed protein product [Pararhodospirillum photometricum DSM 122]